MISSFLKIDSVNMPEPGAFRITGNDLDSENTQRLENGNLQRDVIGFAWRTPGCEWNGIPQAESQTLLTAIKKASFTVTYTDPADGVVTKTCYASPWEAERVPGSDPVLWNISFDIIECRR